VLSLLALCSSFFASVSAQASPLRTIPGTLTTAGRVAQNQKQVAAYWTPQRLRTARNVDLVLNTKPQALSAAPQASLHGAAGVISPAVSATSKLSSAGARIGNALKPYDYSYPFPYSRFAVSTSLYTSWPYETNGKVFFTDSRTGSNYVCSGTAVNSKNLSVVDTAGHCVVQGGSSNNWYTNWVFCPGYIDGSCQLGIWYEYQPWSYSYWSVNGLVEYDLAAVVVWPNNGWHLVSYVGGEGIAWNYSRNQYYTAFGYPAASPFNGNRMIECQAPYATTSAPDGKGTPMTGIGCDMTGGSSGGGWLFSFGSSGGYVNGHNDWKYYSQPLAMYSPYYGSEEGAVYNAAANVSI
jgi:hypothetical protein